MSAGTAAVIAIVAFQVCSDVFRHGADDMQNFRPAESNRATDDRTAILWLMRQRRPGDVVVTSRLGLPAILWYGNLPGTHTAAVFHDGGTVLVAEHSSLESECGTSQLRDRLKGRPRVLAYLGFQDFPAWFDDRLLQILTDGGAVVAMRQFGSKSRAVIVALDAPDGSMKEAFRWNDAADEPLSQPYGCVTGREARRW